MLREALAYAKRGIPVFPCRAGGKEPLTPRGFKDATADPRKVHAYWRRWPGANIGIPTGSRSGLLVLDEDRAGAIAELEEEHEPLPATTRARTGGGGLHLWFRLHAGVGEVRNSAGRLAEGLDVRGEGGYVVAPPSHTEGAYGWLDKTPLAEPPAWLIEALSGPSGAASEDTGKRTGVSRGAVSVDPAGPTIPEGGRNEELARVAGKLHDGTRGADQLAADLAAINDARCSPPLPAAEVERITASIHRRSPCLPSKGVTPEVLEELDGIEAAFWRREWPGMGWKTARSIMVALIKKARRHGEKIPAGIRVTIGLRDLALLAASSKPSVIKGTRRLREAGVIRADNADRSGPQAGAWVLLSPRANVDHSPTAPPTSEKVGASGKGLRAPFTAPRLRWSAPVFERDGGISYRVGTIRRLGKGCEAVVDALERRGGFATLAELAADLGVKRPRDLRRRYLFRLEGVGVVGCAGDAVSLAGDWLAALEAERERSGETERERLDRASYKREQKAFAKAWAAGEVVSKKEHEERRREIATTKREAVEARREDRERRAALRGADGFIEDLERLPPDSSEDLPEERERVLSSLAAAVRDYLERNPQDSDQPAGWLAVTLWAYDLVRGKPSRDEVRTALGELEGAGAVRGREKVPA